MCNGRSKIKLIFLIGKHLNGHYIYAVSSLDAETLKKYHSFTEKNNHTLKIPTTLSFNPQAFRSKKTFIPLSLYTTPPSRRPSSFSALEKPTIPPQSFTASHPSRSNCMHPTTKHCHTSPCTFIHILINATSGEKQNKYHD